MLTCALLTRTTAEPDDVDTVCSITLLVSTSCAAPSTILIFPPVTLFSAMPTSPLTMAQNMKAAMVPKMVGFDRKRDYELGRVRVRAPRCRPGRRALIVGEVDGRA